ncbi:MAG: hypothetical protein ACI9I0_002671 [Rhodoferax sp.]|jgi:hypothetical protein
MLDGDLNQAAGLQGLALQSGQRVLALASHGNQQGELPLLWNLCASLVDFGFPVVVLDATTPESTENPGLAQLLSQSVWPEEVLDESAAWSVVPAARGLQQLSLQANAQTQVMTSLSRLFSAFGVLVIYARAEVLSQLLAGSGMAPLLTVSSVKMSSVTAYQALKHLLHNAGLRPTLAHLSSDPISKTIATLPAAVKNLQDCAMTFLDYRLDSITVRTSAAQDGPSDDINRLVLRLLEQAMPLQRHHAGRVY